MKRMKLKPFVVPTVYVLSIILFVVSIFFIQRTLSDMALSKEKDDLDYVDKDIDFKEEVPVINSDNTTIVKPYTNQEIKVIKTFYDYQADEVNQESSILYFENTYMQNSGVDYQGKDNFEVISILDGTVLKVSEDKNLGKLIEVQHSNDMISIYQSLSETTVKEKQEIKQGDVIGKSGTANIALDLKDHLHFELLHKGMVVNPELYFDKKLKDL